VKGKGRARRRAAGDGVRFKIVEATILARPHHFEGPGIACFRVTCTALIGSFLINTLTAFVSGNLRRDERLFRNAVVPTRDRGLTFAFLSRHCRLTATVCGNLSTGRHFYLRYSLRWLQHSSGGAIVASHDALYWIGSKVTQSTKDICPEACQPTQHSISWNPVKRAIWLFFISRYPIL
jgi:hypothetical protein